MLKQAGVGHARVAQAERFEVRQPFQVNQADVADGRVVEFQTCQAGQACQILESGIRDLRPGEIHFLNRFDLFQGLQARVRGAGREIRDHHFVAVIPLDLNTQPLQ